ncbi:competence type IV pilus minor pilin ComGG [Enterococcus sp. HY326]|uniref:competence type IV pilus minor pilin ComGG n=1 Tax=Enterococcus sp. HY326 TaxID=2971265 RepID=UPI00223FF31F|nr:competence type IV pilus minor pilin ComGG [Enterococcus sp. HY326]
MGKKVREAMFSKNIKKFNNWGGVFLSTMLLAFLFSSCLLWLTADYQTTVEDFKNIRSFYLARTIKELFLYEYYDGAVFSENPVVYNCGTVQFKENQQLELIVRVGKYRYDFKEELKGTDFLRN